MQPRQKHTSDLTHVVIKFAGDSGDGMQLVGSEFGITSALQGNQIASFPDFPAEIRAPKGTEAGVSGFQLHFSSEQIYTAGDAYDVLVAMNAASLKKEIKGLKKGGILILNTDGFTARNLKQMGYEESLIHTLKQEGEYNIHPIAATKLTKEALKDISLSTKAVDRCKNMFMLGFVYWLYQKPIDNTVSFITQKFKSLPDVLEANKIALQKGNDYGETTEAINVQYSVAPSVVDKGTYRNIRGNEALAMGLTSASVKAGIRMLFASYPITPASDILHSIVQHKGYGVETLQAEDEIAAICSAIGASYAGQIGATATSGPGMALKAEALGLATMIELPLVVINVQRGGPSTGLPTKTEQADLMQAMYGRNGECPVAVIAPSSSTDCFEKAYKAVQIAIRYMTPVILLSDAYIANGISPWKIPSVESLSPITRVNFNKYSEEKEEVSEFLPYQRNKDLARSWVVPGTAGLSHRVGGIEKEDLRGNISYDPDNHQKMVQLRKKKVEGIEVPEQTFAVGDDKDEIIIVGWGSTFGSIKGAVLELREQGHCVSHLHIEYLYPMPANLGRLLSRAKVVIVPEMNSGQLSMLLRSEYLVHTIPFEKVKGVPFHKKEIIDFTINCIKDFSKKEMKKET